MAEEKQITYDANKQDKVREPIGQIMNSVSIMRRYSRASALLLQL